MAFIRQIFPAQKRRRIEGPASEVETPAPRKTSIKGIPNPKLSPSKLFHQICHEPQRILSRTGMRLVLVQEEGARTIFDTASIVPLDETEGKSVPRSQISPCGRFQFLKRQRDLAIITPMLFGAMPSVSGTDSFKIHTLDETNKIMVSRLFGLPRFGSANGRTTTESVMSSDSDTNYSSTVRSLDGLRSSKSMCITAPPEGFTRVRNTSLHLDSDCVDDGLRAFSPPHRLSKTRRIQMSHRANMCHEGSAMRFQSRSRLSSCGSQSEDDFLNMRKVGLGVLWDEAESSFLFKHIALLETEMTRMEQKIVAAASHSSSHFMTLIQHAWDEFLDAVTTLANTPRLRQPVWLSMLEGNDKESDVVAREFCDRLAYLASILDTKETKYFLSNLLSAILMHHMSWVASVAPPTQHQATLQRKSELIGSVYPDDPALAPYNVHMAQFLEVVGSVGSTGRSAKTVVAGKLKDQDTVLAILHVLSYFIRCSSIQHNKVSEEECCWQLPDAESFSPQVVTPPELATSPKVNEQPVQTPEKDDDDCMSYGSNDSLPPFNMRMVPVTATLGVMGMKRTRERSMDMPPRSLVSNVMTEFDFSLGRSLLAGPTSIYSPHFVLSGLLKSNNNIADAFVRMLDEVRVCPDPSETVGQTSTSLSSSQSSSSAGDGMMPPENVIILGDTNDWTVKVMSSEGLDEVHAPSEAIVSMIEQFVDLHSLGLAPKFLISHLEDSLSDVLAKSLSLVEMVSGVPGSSSFLSDIAVSSSFSSERVKSVIGCDHSDLRLILNVAAVYFPQVLSSVV